MEDLQRISGGTPSSLVRFDRMLDDHSQDRPHRTDALMIMALVLVAVIFASFYFFGDQSEPSSARMIVITSPPVGESMTGASGGAAEMTPG